MRKLGRIHLHDDVVLSDNEMKKVLGGSGAEKSCTYTINCAQGSISCTDDNGDCKYITKVVDGTALNVGVSCGGTEHRCTDSVPDTSGVMHM